MTASNRNLPAVTMRLSPPETLGDLDRTFYDEAVQTMPVEQLRELQLTRLRGVVDRALNTPIPLFQRKLKEAGIASSRDIASLADLDQIPLTVKQELRDSEADNPPIGDYRGTALRDAIRIGRSTGTTGAPTLMLWTRHDLLEDYEAGARMFWRQGVRPGMILTHAHPAYLYAGGPMLQGVHEHLGCLSVWVPPPDTDELAQEALEFWQRITPDRPFLGFATGRFMEVAAKLGIDPVSAGLDFSKAAPMGKPGEPLGLMTAGAECMPYLGSACTELNGAHLASDLAIVQAVDPDTGRTVPDGQWGRLVVTSINRDNFLVRYDLEETTRLDHAPCPCGETHVRGWWGGRVKDLVVTQDRSFMLFDIENPLRSVRALRKPSLEYVVVRPAPDGRDAPLRIRVENGDGDHTPADALAQAQTALRDALGVRVDIDLLDRDTLPRAGYKAARIVDHDDELAR